MAQKFLSIKNFEKYQSCKSGKEGRPWIKLYKKILVDPEFIKLSTHDRFIYLGMLILADDCGNKICNDATYLIQRLYVSDTDIIRNQYTPDTDAIQRLYNRHTKLDLKALYRSGFLATSNLSRTLSEKEKSREETETETETAQAPTLPLQVVVKEKKRPGPLPEDFKFNADLREWALAKGCKEPFAEFERFCSKAESKGWVYVDWAKAYKNWVLNELKWQRERVHA